MHGHPQENYQMLESSFVSECLGDLPQKRHNSHEGRSKAGSVQNRGELPDN